MDKNKKSRKEKNSKNYTRNYFQQKTKKKNLKGEIFGKEIKKGGKIFFDKQIIV